MFEKVNLDTYVLYSVVTDSLKQRAKNPRALEDGFNYFHTIDENQVFTPFCITTVCQLLYNSPGHSLSNSFKNVFVF